MFKKALDINVENYDAIISWSQWHSVHLMAAKIKSRFPSLPWVVHMSDPWSNNPFLKKIIGYPISQYFLERRVIKNADAISFTTNEARFLVMKKYPSSWINKTYVTPHSYDTRFYKKAPQYLDNAKFTISYLGNFYGPRNPSLFAQAVSAICKEQEDFFDGVTIKFIGKWIGHENWDPKDYGIPDGIIKIEPPVPYLKSLEEMNNSNLLLILDAPFKKSVFFPSKLVDYIGSGRPIFAITPEGSCSDILLKVGGIIASPESEKSIADGLRLAVQKLKDNTVKSPAKEMCKQYSNDNVGYQFAVLFDQVIKG